MTRIRTIKPAFFRSLDIVGLPIATRLTFIGLWTYVDDFGRGPDDARLLKAEVWPLDDSYTTRKVEGDLALLAKKGLIERYVVSDRRYLRVTGWTRHQRVSHPFYVNPPSPTETDEDSGAAPESHTNGSGSARAGSGTRSRFTPEPFRANSEPLRPEIEREIEKGNRASTRPSRPAGRPGPTPGEKPSSPSALMAAAAASAEAARKCGRCDGGWIEGDSGLVRCECQAVAP